MAMKFKEHEDIYKNQKVSTGSSKDLCYLYEDQKMSTTEIAKDVFKNKISNTTIARRLKKYGIQARGSKDENNYFWNGGIKIDKSGYRLIKNNVTPILTIRVTLESID